MLLAHANSALLALRSRRNSFLRSERGSAVLELAFVVAFFAMPLLGAACELAIVVYDSIEVSSAANAAANYAMQSTTDAADTSGITTAARNDSPDLGTALTATPTGFYVCSNAITGTHYSTQSAATSACTSGRVLQFVQIDTTVSITPPFRVPSLPTSFTVKGSAVTEVEQ